MSPIKDFYRDEAVFITGASGFIGKALVEKVLRTCSGVKTVYLLMRQKKGQTPEDRIKALTENMFFNRLKAEQPDAIKKLKVVEGDAKELGLGLSDSDLEKVKSCSMIFHLAACIRFNDPLKEAILLNTRGAREVCEIAKTMPNLKIFVHVSTAYVQPLNLNVVEELIDVDCDWRDFIKMAENLPTEILDTLTMKLTKFAPNTYTYTKLLAEHICNDYRNKYKLPLVIYRPSVVAYSDSEPFTGWSENMSGVNGIYFSFHAGIKRVHLGNTIMEIIPVDLCAKGMIIAAEKHKKGSEWQDTIPLYNAAALSTFELKTAHASTHQTKDIYFDKAIGLPTLWIVECKYFAYILSIFLQILPALLIDTFYAISGRKRFVMKLQRILKYTEDSLSHFVLNEFKFENSKFKELGYKLHEDDKEDFNLEPRVPLMEYIVKSFIVSKEIVCGETAESAERARKKIPMYIAMGWVLKAILFFIVYKILTFMPKLW